MKNLGNLGTCTFRTENNVEWFLQTELTNHPKIKAEYYTVWIICNTSYKAYFVFNKTSQVVYYTQSYDQLIEWINSL